MTCRKKTLKRLKEGPNQQNPVKPYPGRRKVDSGQLLISLQAMQK